MPEEMEVYLTESQPTVVDVPYEVQTPHGKQGMYCSYCLNFMIHLTYYLYYIVVRYYTIAVAIFGEFAYYQVTLQSQGPREGTSDCLCFFYMFQLYRAVFHRTDNPSTEDWPVFTEPHFFGTFLCTFYTVPYCNYTYSLCYNMAISLKMPDFWFCIYP